MEKSRKFYRLRQFFSFTPLLRPTKNGRRSRKAFPALAHRRAARARRIGMNQATGVMLRALARPRVAWPTIPVPPDACRRPPTPAACLHRKRSVSRPPSLPFAASPHRNSNLLNNKGRRAKERAEFCQDPYFSPPGPRNAARALQNRYRGIVKTAVRPPNG